MHYDTYSHRMDCLWKLSDNGPQFVSEEYEIFLKENGVRHIRSAAYHPASYGEAERAVRTFKQAMNERGMY